MFPKSRTDAELIARANAGDLDAFDQLIARHRVRVLAIARQIAGNPEAAQDIAQDAFLNAYRSLGSLHDQLRFGPWLNTIVRRQAQRFLRDGNRTPEPMDCEMVHIISGGWPQPEPEPPAEVVERLRAALEILTQRERKVMILHYLEGRTCEEIASQLRLPAGSVKRILYNSRQKAKKESVKMKEAEKKKGPRELHLWMDGNSMILWKTIHQLMGRFASTICLDVNKTAKTARQIADDILGHDWYVDEMIGRLVDAEVLSTPKKGQYLLSFIALDAEDWRRMTKLLPEPAAQIAAQLARAQERLQTAFLRTPLAASGWSWDDLAWPIYAGFVSQIGISRHLPEFKVAWSDLPAYVDGGNYCFGARENKPGLTLPWSLSSRYCEIFGTFSVSGISHAEQLMPEGRMVPLLNPFLSAPRNEVEVLSRLGGDSEKWRGMLADLISKGILKRADGLLAPAIPVLSQEDSDILTQEVDEIVRLIIREYIVPFFKKINTILDEAGYSHHRDQFPQWCRWFTYYLLGEALRFMMEQGVLPKPPDPAPANFAFIAWKEG